MSDLHKLFLKRIKERENASGLNTLSEDADSGIEALHHSEKMNITPQLNRTRKVGDDKTNTEILELLESEKNRLFPIQDKYYNSESNISFQTYFSPPQGKNAPIFILHHGAGSSSMTFCKLSEALTRSNTAGDKVPGVFTFDARGHGNTESDKNIDYLLSVLTKDCQFIVNTFLEKHISDSSLFLVGHSLGGAVFTNCLVEQKVNSKNIRGLVMLDIVEETAVRALNSMPAFINKRPTSFLSLQACIDWHIKEMHLLHNEDSAKLSIPDLLNRNSLHYYWKTDLKETSPYWPSWFTKLSENFISCGTNVAKMLILSGHETLDTNLIVGQMQGKYQLVVFNNNPKVGHFLHEDIPSQIAITLMDFVRRNDNPEDYMKNELGFIPKWGGKINR